MIPCLLPFVVLSRLGGTNADDTIIPAIVKETAAPTPTPTTTTVTLSTAAAVGKREVLVKEVVFDSPVADIQYLGVSHECILVTTKSMKLYFSEDAGQSWKDITDKVEPSPNVELHAEQVIINPNDKTVAVLKANRRTKPTEERLGDAAGQWLPYTYVSENSGRSWRKAWGKHHGLHSWISHPRKRNWALVSWWTGDCANEAGKVKKVDTPEDEDTKSDGEACAHRLMLTTDLGKNFVQVAPYVVQFSWGSVGHKQENRIYFTSYRNKQGDQAKLSMWTSEVDFFFAEVSAEGRVQASQQALKYGNKFMVSNEYILVAKVKNEKAQTVNLMVSKDGGSTFQAALLPSGMGDMEERWYTVLDTSEGAVILHVNSNGDGSKETGRIFISDSDGLRFTQSLVNNVRSAQGACEFDKVVSLQGVYLANVVVPDGSASAQQPGFTQERESDSEKVELEAALGAETDKKHGGRGFSSKARASKEERTIRTVISFDKGGAWNYLKPPRVDSVGKTYECAGKPIQECALHLHGTTSWDLYAPFYSVESAVGIIMGTGNVGPSLRFEPEETDTFLSRDGGLTWMQAHKGAFIYEFGDHGGLILMADDLKKTTQVVFTWNEGQSWFDFNVAKTPFEVDNILTQPNLTSTTFVMFGSREEAVGVLYYLKFDSLNFPKCHGVWAADSVASDYETWTPSDGVNTEACILGQQITYTRRKRTSTCFNGEDFERVASKKVCPCTQEDFACEVGFMREVGSTICKYGGPELMPDRIIPPMCSGSFSVDAYRKVPGDMCDAGWQPEKVKVPCPSVITRSNVKYGIVALALSVVAYAIYLKFIMAEGSSSGPLGDFTAKTGKCGSPMGLATCICGWIGSLTSRSRGISQYPDLSYKKLGGDDFDLDTIGATNEESLSEFLDEADNDDFAPRVYNMQGSSAANTAAANESFGSDSPGRSVVAGGAKDATEPVPMIQGPPTGAASVTEAAAPITHFNIGHGDEDLL
eukprot:TRINITY_DN17699_c0_g1_i1.p1 TRINITY_DN17699_c0_g1~~TRINITY_DN17699_c0_g1_i1.p1  ORF type:complete len:1016 (+),score=209.35 TRINITY_DN17699_c0_g1_i1:93-3050(+)